jgi:dUTP pyrophosphatase
MVELRVKLVHPAAKMPTRAHEDDAGWDFYSCADVAIPIGGWAEVPTGVCCELRRMSEPGKHAYLHLKDRSGMAFKRHLHIVAGVVDEGYRGEITFKMHNLGDKGQLIRAGDKVAQGIIHLIPVTRSVVVDELGKSKRGAKGFGSSDEKEN